ncbi:hypothetical protein IWX75_002689 [Arthrobacter sp. CAN_A6]|uniref:hypothetical protein n=1 Tax=Arthrobacter sp. CAN_A6 TaxID=2787721 RepID=UPI0018C9984E
MTVTKKWVAAGSTATLLAGGLFLGAPMASAAPGDAACLQASTKFNAALGAAGIDVVFVNQLELATAAVVATAENLEVVSQAALTSEAAVTAEAQLPIAEGAVIAAEEVVLGAEAVLVQTEADALVADPEADPNQNEAVIAAQQGLLGAQADLEIAVADAEVVFAAYEAAVYTPEVQAAEAAFIEASEEAGAFVALLGGDDAAAAEILALFKAFLAACDASAIGVDPVTPVTVPAPVAPVITPAAPVTRVAPVAKGAPVAPVATNKGLNVQTAVVGEDNNGAAVALIAALLAVGVAVPAATAARMRRLERAQS